MTRREQIDKTVEWIRKMVENATVCVSGTHSLAGKKNV